MFEKSLRDKNKKYLVDNDYYSVTGGFDIWYFTRELGKDLIAMPMEKFLEKWDKKEFWRIPSGYLITEGTPHTFDTWLTDESQIFISDFEATLRTELSRRGLRMSGLHVCAQDFSAYITDGKGNYELFHWRTPTLRTQFNFTLGGADTGVIYRPVLNEKDIWGLKPHSKWNYSSFKDFPDKIKLDFDRGMEASSLGYSQYDTVCIAPHFLDINGSDARRVSVQERTENFLMWKRGQKYTHSQEFRDIYSRPDATPDDIQAGFERFPKETRKTLYDDAANEWAALQGAQYGPLDKLWAQAHNEKSEDSLSYDEGEER